MKQVALDGALVLAGMVLVAMAGHAVYEVVQCERSRRERCSRPLVSSGPVEHREAPGPDVQTRYVDDEIAATARRVIREIR